MTQPTIEFFDGVYEAFDEVSLRRNTRTGGKIVVMIFRELKCIEAFKALRAQFSNALRLKDEEGEISVEPSGVKFYFGGPEGDDLDRVECSVEIDREDHFERVMRFLHRFAEANGMGYDEGK
ncbi:MAG: photosystem II reaction center protein Psb28 [Cyanobacteria bacterium P01_C01_bin.89]